MDISAPCSTSLEVIHFGDIPSNLMRPVLYPNPPPCEQSINDTEKKGFMVSVMSRLIALLNWTHVSRMNERSLFSDSWYSCWTESPVARKSYLDDMRSPVRRSKTGNKIPNTQGKVELCVSSSLSRRITLDTIPVMVHSHEELDPSPDFRMNMAKPDNSCHHTMRLDEGGSSIPLQHPGGTLPGGVNVGSSLTRSDCNGTSPVMNRIEEELAGRSSDDGSTSLQQYAGSSVCQSADGDIELGGPSPIRSVSSQNTESSDSTMKVAREVLALTGQAAASFMVYNLSGQDAKPKWPFQFVVAANGIGFISTLSATFLHSKNKKAANILGKVGAIAAAGGIVVATGMSFLPQNMMWVAGPPVLLLAIAIALA
ncbi:uncharacterized protein LOC132294719 [Cornus florida]|uniref:uncharacterized protein LOC132294719 n=1 Tax=Cornus florida TaxID=4283 RepID=UPI00289E80D2|nr:uncharacterized protein LOC132294719 [Cornus florida]